MIISLLYEMFTGLGPLSGARLHHFCLTSDFHPLVPPSCVHTPRGGCVSPAEERPSSRRYRFSHPIFGIESQPWWLSVAWTWSRAKPIHRPIFKKGNWFKFRPMVGQVQSFFLKQNSWNNWSHRWGKARNKQGNFLIQFLVEMLHRPLG